MEIEDLRRRTDRRDDIEGREFEPNELLQRGWAPVLGINEVTTHLLGFVRRSALICWTQPGISSLLQAVYHKLRQQLKVLVLLIGYLGRAEHGRGKDIMWKQDEVFDRLERATV
jgi:hypothetical protein